MKNQKTNALVPIPAENKPAGLITRAKTDVRFSSVSAKNKDELERATNAIKMVMRDVGIDKTPDPIHIVRTIKFIKTFYPGLTIDEFKLAFDLMAAGKIPMVEHYQSFNKQYIGKVITHYRQFTAQKLLPEHRETVLDPEKTRAEFKQTMIDKVLKFKKTGMLGFVNSYVYKFFVEVGEVEPDLEISNESMMIAVKARRRECRTVGELTRIDNHLKNGGDHRTQVLAELEEIKTRLRIAFDLADTDKLIERIKNA